MTTYQQLGTEIGELVAAKNAAYGSSFAKSGAFLRLLFPDGVPADRADDALLLVRIFDKQMRIATDQDAFGESPYSDIAGYGLLGAKMHEERKSKGCGSVSAAVAEEESRAHASSAARSAVPQITPIASERSASSSAPPLSSPSQPTSASTAASAPIAMGAAFASGVDPLRDLVQRFSVVLLAKLRDAEAKYGYNNAWLRDDWDDELRADLHRHVQKGDPRDVAIYCAFLWHHGWRI